MSKSDLETLVADFSIDRASPLPLYFQVATHFENAITSGLLPPGTLFENEILLADRIGVSRPTMRRAMEQLVDQGMIVRRRGIGTRVVQPKVRRPLELTSLYDDLATAGRKPTTTVLAFESLPADEEVATKLGLTPGAPVVKIVRLRAAQVEPIAVMTNYLPADLVTFGASDLAERGLYDLLRRKGIHLHSATQTVGARNATPQEAVLLDQLKGTALLTMQRETLDDTGRVVEYATHLYVANNYSFEIHLVEP